MADAKVLARLAAGTGLPLPAVEATVALLEAGLAPPFVARYRKERTGGLREEQVRELARGLRHLAALQKRKAALLHRLTAQGTLPDALRERIENCSDRDEVEDLCLASRPKRRTRGTLAKERGLEPLARVLWMQAPDSSSLEGMAAPFVDPARELPDAATALEGARHILTEWIAEDAENRRRLRQLYADTGLIRAHVAPGKEGQHSKYESYYSFAEPAKSIPSHRVLAVRRGEKEGWLEARVEVDRERALALLRETTLKTPDAATAPAIEAALADAFDRLLAPAFDAALRTELKRRADLEAIRVFAQNLRNLLLQPPAGPRRTLGVEPGLRTGCKLAVVDADGKLLAHATLFPHEPDAKLPEAQAAARTLLDQHAIEAIAIGDGTAARETYLFFRKLLQERGGKRPVCMVVNEAGAAVYATSRAAREEFPDLEPALRAAVSIARRFQNPLHELTQVDPKVIGVGQYQHDVNQQALREALEAEVVACVNTVGVDVNRASAALLAYVAGLDKATAHELVQYRAANGPFRSREALKAVPRMTPERFQQAAAFLRIRADGPARPGDQPLDATAIPPEHYPLVERMAADLGTPVPALLGNKEALAHLDLARYASDTVGPPTLADLRRELLHPGRDPRPPFRSVEFAEGVTDLAHLQPGMALEGVVTNVTNFGAFVDIGVQEDGLVHVSELARRFVRDPNEAVHVGQIVRVKVLGVDSERRRISLSIKQALPPPKPRPPAPRPKGKPAEPKKAKEPPPAPNRPATAEDIARLIAHFARR